MSDINLDMNNIKIDYIKHYIDSHLEKTGVYSKLNSKFNNIDFSNEDDLIEKLNEEGIIDNILDSINNNWDSLSPHQTKPNQKGIFIKIKKASNFHEFLLKADFQIGIDILFLGERVNTKPVFAGSEMIIDQGFFMEFNKNGETRLDIDNLLRLYSPIHLVIYSISKGKDGIDEKNLLGTKLIEWRWCLCFGTWSVTSEVYSNKSISSKICLGDISLSVSLMPFVNKKNLFPERVVSDHLSLEKKMLSQSHQDYVVYANNWWEEYKSIRKTHSTRLVKLFLQTDDKETFSYKLASSLLYPIVSSRSMSTPYEAARFVSLIPYKTNLNINNSKEETFSSIHTFLTLKYGDVEEHSILLCNLLLGFGLDAYVAIGISVNGPHCWVITRGLSDSSSSQKQFYSITFWESLTGQRTSVTDPKVYRFYKKIHSVFSHKSFYANIQSDDTVCNTSYTFEDEFLWKTIPKDKIENMNKFFFVPNLSLSQSNLVIFQNEVELEKEIIDKIIMTRRGKDLNTVFDNDFSYILSPTLTNYELERISGITYGNEEFKQSVKTTIPEGYTFKAFPCHSTIINSDMLFSICIGDQIGNDIITTRGDNVKFGIRVKIISYPQDVYSIWMMIAVKYRPIK